MSQNFYYEDVKIIKKPLKKRIKSYLIFFLIFLIFGGIVVSAMYISRSLTVSNISTLFVYGGTDIKMDERKVYAVSLGVYSSMDDASKVAIGTTIQGAGGFVWEDNSSFYVLGSIYKDRSSAESVVENLSISNYEISILEIGMSKVKLSFDDLENKQVASISDAIDYFSDCYEKLYDYSIAFDKSEMNNLAISSFVSGMRGEVKVHISNMQSLLSMPNAKIQEVQNALIKLDELLDQTIIKTIDNSSTASSLKYSICSVVEIEYEMRQNLV